MATPTFLIDTAANTARAAEVPGEAGVTWVTGLNWAGSCAPGIGINVGDGEVVGTAEQFTLLDQDGAARTPQVSGVIGHDGFVNRSTVDWPSSGGVEGKATDPIQDGVVTNEGDGNVTPSGSATLATLLAGWTSVP